MKNLLSYAAPIIGGAVGFGVGGPAGAGLGLGAGKMFNEMAGIKDASDEQLDRRMNEARRRLQQMQGYAQGDRIRQMRDMNRIYQPISGKLVDLYGADAKMEMYRPDPRRDR